jgi:hypothetical protein
VASIAGCLMYGMDGIVYLVLLFFFFLLQDRVKREEEGGQAGKGRQGKRRGALVSLGSRGPFRLCLQQGGSIACRSGPVHPRTENRGPARLDVYQPGLPSLFQGFTMYSNC